MFTVEDPKGRRWRIEKNDLGLFKTLIGRYESEENRFIPNLPKVPEELWWQMVKFFQYYADKHLEAACCLLFDRKKREYEMMVPVQRVEPAVVDYNIEMIYEYLDLHPDIIWVADFHSHHQMMTFFSSTDDRNERGTRLYGVFGDFDPKTREFNILLRAGCHGMYTRLDAADLLENYEERNSFINKIKPRCFPIFWARQVDTSKVIDTRLLKEVL